jgi:hypothetical protein
MTLLETERLVRKISELPPPGDPSEIAPKLAGDYAAACHAANLRLQQCEAMIKAGDRPQAIQLAETAPNLLDLVTVLEFHGADEWRGYCRQNSLPVAERIDGRSVQLLNEGYAQGITTDHPLYAAYRRAVLNRNDEEALKTLQSITRLNPADANAAAELTRLDAKVLAAKVEHLAHSLTGAEPGLLVAEMEAIEAFGFKHPPEGEGWRQAQAVRCEYLLGETVKLQSAGDWREALAQLDFIHRLQNDFTVALPAAALRQLDTLGAWARGEQERDQRERQFQSRLVELQQRIQQSEEKDTSARYVQLPELRDDFEALHKVWRSLTDFARPIPGEATAGFRKRAALLEAEIARRTAIHRRLIIAGSVTLLVIGGAIAWLVLGRIQARDFNRQLQAAITQRQLHAMDRLLERARTGKMGDAGTVAAAETLAAREHALAANFETAFQKLPSQLSGEPGASRLAELADELARARDAWQALAPDLKTENEPRLQAFEKSWQNYLADSGTAVNGLLSQWVAAAEKQGDELDYRAPLDKTTRQLAALSDNVQKIQDCESGFGKNLTLRSDLLERGAAVRGKFAAYEGELEKLDQGQAALPKARTLQEFSGGIKLITASEFTGTPAASAALAVQALEVGDETALRVLLAATNASVWACVKKTGAVNFIPELVMPAERQLLLELNADPAVNAHHEHYRLWLDNEGNDRQDWITAGVFEDTTGWKRIKAWTLTANATRAIFEDRDYGWFAGEYKLSPTQPIFRLERLGALEEAAAFHSVGLEQVPAGNAYAKPLLEVLDAIKASPDGSPLFRAYLYLRLMEVMNLQPNAWGLAFCPAARMQAAQISSLVGGSLESGDWFVPARVNADSQKLEQFFASVKSVSLMKQAVGCLTLARSVTRDGLQYAGFVGLDGQPHYVDQALSGEVFGYRATDRQLVWLAPKMEAGPPGRVPALPLSPLFALSRPRAEYLANAGVQPDDASFQGALPPLFQSPTQP